MAINLEKVREYFKKDTFAAQNGINIVSVDEKSAVVECTIRQDHYNCKGTVQGGLIFTLADFAFAVVTNWGELSVISQNIAITYVRPALGGKLTAVAKVVSEGRSMMLVEAEVYNDQNKLIARMLANGFKLKG